MVIAKVCALAFATLLSATGCAPGAALDDAVGPPAAPAPTLPVRDSDEHDFSVLDVDFADPDHAFALLYRCEGEHRCEQQLTVFANGRWTRRPIPLPPVAQGDGPSAVIRALGPQTALVTEYRSVPDLPGLFTSDGGRTWREVPAGVSGTAERIAPGAPLTTSCTGDTDENGFCPRPVLTTLDPQTGREQLVASQPPRGIVHPAGAGSPDGSRWVWGTEPGTGVLALAVSRDDGATWHTTRLGSEKPSQHVFDVEVAGGPRVWYATVRGQLPSGSHVKNGLVALYRSTDGGQTWQRRWSYRPGQEPQSVLGTAVVARDRVLVIAEVRGRYLSTDGGRTFRQVSDESNDVWVRTSRVGYVASPGGTVHVSRDGTTWREYDPIEPLRR